ncbi:NTP transferase domain-containing protein [Dactylosporangium sp. NPDC051541]|uniref:phosphocholine cytidylyltransferase family protein n=1 Tax=Dactylosporangium sp. NPDC051541 TaxID=3363977 RepID=UPI0037909605
MSPLHVVILAAGMGTRLGRSDPKPLTRLADGRSIMAQQVANVRHVFGRRARIMTVVGYRKEQVMAAFPDFVFLYNKQFERTNTSKSLLLGLRAAAPSGALWLNGDVVFDADVLHRAAPLIDAEQSFLCVNTASVGEEEMKYTLGKDGCVAALSKRLAGGLGEAVGINYVSRHHISTLVRRLEECRPQDYFERGIELAVKHDSIRFAALDVSGSFAVEVDFPEDLERVNTERRDGRARPPNLLHRP